MWMMYYERMRDLREDHDLKQTVVAAWPGITQQQYSLYESGKRKPPIDVIIALCKRYNVSADYLLGLTNEYRSLS